MYINEYAVVQETDLQQLQNKVNRLAREGYNLYAAYGIPDHRAHSHVMWMIRTVESRPEPPVTPTVIDDDDIPF